MWVDWHQAHWLELARQSSQVRRLGAGRGHRVTPQPSPTHPHKPHSHWAQWGSLAAEWRTLLRALQGTPTPTPPAARCIPLSAGALMPLTEGILGVQSGSGSPA